MATKTTTKKTTTSAPKGPKSAASRPDRDPGDAAKFISLANGTFVYACYPKGHSVKMSTSSPQFQEIVSKMVADGLGAKLHDEVMGHAQRWPRGAWPSLLTELERTNAFGIEEISA